MHTYTQQLIDRGAIKLPSYKKAKRINLKREFNYLAGELRYENDCIIDTTVETAIEEALRNLDVEDRLDKIESMISDLEDLPDQLSDLERDLVKLDDRLEGLAEFALDMSKDLKGLGNVHKLTAARIDKLEEIANKPKGRLARWLGL